jgi:transcriptional regulator with XRE-family HTH domain
MEEPQILATSRKAAGLSQRDLASALGISPQYLCDIETGRREVPWHLLGRLPQPIRAPIVRARIAELEKLL